MSVNTYWKSLTAAALLGTERQALPSAAGTALESLLAEGQNKEEALLNAAAMAALYRRSGRVLAASAQPQMEAAPADLLPEMNSEQHACLEAALGGNKRELLDEVLYLAARAKRRPYRGWVFRVVEEAAGKPALRPDALQVIDERGRWLARFVEFGGWVTPRVLDEQLWEEGRLEERLAYLEQVRCNQPQHARQLVEEVWVQESHDVKAKLLEVLQTNLSMGDEPFLETCLDDRRKEVRTAAQNLLNQMPTSRLVERMIERVKPLLSIELPKPQGIVGGVMAAISGKNPAVKIEVTLPEKFEKDWARDGLEQKSVPYGMGEKTWWLQQIISRVPPSMWGEPKELIAAVSRDKEWNNTIIEAWHQATIRFNELNWIRSMMGYFDDHRATNLISSLPPAELHAQTLHRLKSGTGPLRYDNTEWQFVQACAKPYSPEILEAMSKRATISLLNWQKMDQKSMDWRAHYTLQQLALLLPPGFIKELHPSIRQTLSTPEHPLFEAFKQFEETLEFRHQMHQVYGENNG